jgi:hypothetical protein
MSNDIVKRLRSWRHDSWPSDPSFDAAAEIERLRARVVELRDLVGYLAGRNNDHIRVMLAGNPDACDRLIERARAALEAQP